MKREILQRKLEDDLHTAREWREQAAAEFDAAIQSVSAPEHYARLAAASREYSLALEAVDTALKQYDAFVLARKEATFTRRAKVR